MRNLLFRLLVVAAAQTLTLSAMAAGPKNAAPERKAASEKVHRLLIHVDQNDPAVMKFCAQQCDQRGRILPIQGPECCR